MSRYLRALVLAAAMATVWAVPAGAHQGNPNYRSVIDRVSPTVPGFKLQVLGFDSQFQLTNPPERVILNLHCPPYASGLDDAPGLNADMTPKHGGHAPEPVGSKAVRTAIKETKPALSLHGHIHEARGHTRIGDTLCINPGSAYEQGELLGAVIELSGKKVKKFVLTSG